MSRLAATGSAHTSTPKTLAVPASGRSSPTAIDRAVVLPAPLGPTSPKKEPRGTARSRWSTAVVSPNCLRRPASRSAGACPSPSVRVAFSSIPHNLPVPLRGTLLLVPEER